MEQLDHQAREIDWHIQTIRSMLEDQRAGSAEHRGGQSSTDAPLTAQEEQALLEQVRDLTRRVRESLGMNSSKESRERK